MSGKVRSFKVFHPYTSEDEIPMLCGITEMCRFFQCAEPTMRARCKNQQIPAFKVDGTWYVHKEDLLNLGRNKQEVS